MAVLSTQGLYAQSSSDSLVYPLRDNRPYDKTTPKSSNNFNLGDPKILREQVTYNRDKKDYKVEKKMGERRYDLYHESFQDYWKKRGKQSEKEYWKQLADANYLLSKKVAKPNIPELDKEKDKIFGSNFIQIKPQGNVDLTFGWRYQNLQNPALNEQARKFGTFNFDMDIRMNVQGKIGDLMNVNFNYNSKATFDFENKMRLNYNGKEDGIIRKIEAGNVDFPLSTSLINGSQNLFGIKTQLQFGRLTVTNVISRKQTKQEEIQIQGGAQTQKFQTFINEYDDDRHFFLAHYFRDNYNLALANLPIITSQINITNIEVWITNKRGYAEDARDIVAFMDLGENSPYRNDVIQSKGNPLPYAYTLNVDRNSNDLYDELINPVNNNAIRSVNSVVSTLEGAFDLLQVQDFEKTYARKLNANEYQVNEQLGFISLNQRLNPDEVLAVAFEYTANGQVYQVGEFSQDVPQGEGTPQLLILKMLKSTSIRPNLPIWDLMMKNVYSIGGFQINPQDFDLNIHYLDPGGGDIRYLPEGPNKGVPLLSLLNLDQLNNQGDNMPDGKFDFVEGVTILSNNGRIIFPLVEPFGDDLRATFNGLPLAEKYAYDFLYDSTKFIAQQYPEFNRFSLKGTYKSRVSSEISLGSFNIPKGSVTVTAGGQVLTEGQDYTIDYNIGRIKIINDAILNSGTPVKVSFENNNLFGFQQKTFFGARVDYWIHDDITLGGTFLRLTERPFTQKVNLGDDPIANNIFGIDGTYKKQTPWLTKWIDKLPIVETKAPSVFTISGEVARLQPGHSRLVGEEGTAYLDDFEGTRSTFDLKFPSTSWKLASTPRGAVDDNGQVLFPEASDFDSLAYGYNRALLSWYNIEPASFLRTNSPTIISYIEENDSFRSSHYVREITEGEIFPQRSNPNNATIPTIFRTLDLSYYPNQKGPYNFDVTGVNDDGTLKNPEDRWGGIMRNIVSTNFEASNVEFIEFWLLDPFLENENHSGGQLYINLGNVSEDILKDSRRQFENGLPKGDGSLPNVDTTLWSIVPNNQSIVNAFDNDPDIRINQDVGFDGMQDEYERTHFNNYLSQIQNVVTPEVFSRVNADPSNDNYLHYRATEYDERQAPIIQRYKRFNGTQGNSPVNDDELDFSTSSTNIPDNEDINLDNTLNESEEYFQYKIDLSPNRLVVGENFIVNKRDTTIGFPDNTSSRATWYQFRIPINEFQNRIGNIQDFKSIRFIRMFLTGFEDSVTCRFATFDLVRNQWRRYNLSLEEPGESLVNDNLGSTEFNVSSVSLEEHSSKEPVNYVLPPEIQREQTVAGASSGTIQLNEQALSVQVRNLADGDARGAFKTLNVDLRNYERIRMFIHAESMISETQLQNGEMTAFIRLGSDFTNNYYEYEIPMTFSDFGSYSNDRDDDRLKVWPVENELNVRIDSLTLLKLLRTDRGIPNNEPYSIIDHQGNKITIIGNPDLGLTQVAMLGVRNATQESGFVPDDDGLPKSTEVWFNELRMVEFFEDGGWAALGRVDLQLADLAKVTFSGNMHTIGFGGLEQKLNERYLDNYSQYDLAASIQLHKFIPEQLGLRIPMYANISESFSNPKYDPYQSDVLFSEVVDRAPDDSTKEALKERSQTYTSIKNINFTNVKKVKTGEAKNSHFYDIENLNLTYAYSEIFNRDPIIQQDLIKRYKGALGYGFAPKANSIKPFKTLKNKSMKLVREFNFSLLPSNITFNTEMNRQFGELILRPQGDEIIPFTTYNKFWTWDRVYAYKHKLAKSVTFDFTAVNNARIDEPFGKIDTDEKKQEVWRNIEKLGRTTQYNHQANINYKVPLNQIDFLNWVQVNTKYSTGYDWVAVKPFTADSIGNTIQNNQDQQINFNFRFTSLYNKSAFLKKYTSNSRNRRRPRGKGKEEEKNENKVVSALMKALLGMKSASINYSENRSTILPGFAPTSRYLGMSEENKWAPGMDFIFGSQPNQDWLIKNQEWLITVNSISYQLAQTETKNFSGRINVEPIKSFKIDINFKKTQIFNHSEFFQIDSLDNYQAFNSLDKGSFTMSINTWATAFDKRDDVDGISKAFKKFQNNRIEVSRILSEKNNNSQGTFSISDTFSNVNYREGYGPYSQDVLIPAFWAAYTGSSVQNAPMSLQQGLFKLLPRPNWRITYNGLSKIEALKKFVQNVTINHSYTATMTIGSYTSNLQYSEDANGHQDLKDPISGNYMTELEVPQISISEQLTPLIGVNATWVNKMTTRVEYKKSRNLNMSFLNNQLSETKSEEFLIGAGYKYKGLKLPFKDRKGNPIILKNDINFQFNFSIRDNITIIYQLDQNLAEPTRGVRTISLNPSIDYKVNDRINIRLFFDRRRSIPATSNSFPTTNANFGTTIRFTLVP